MSFVTVYDLKHAHPRVRWLQEASTTTRDLGFEPTHGLFGSPEWWANVGSGNLPRHLLTGEIAGIYDVGVLPEFSLLDEGGIHTTWIRECNRPEDDELYAVERAVEIDYVLQRSRGDLSPLGIDRTEKCVLAIRIDAPDRRIVNSMTALLGRRSLPSAAALFRLQ
jgi:hypothetical protein